ncbi:inhibitor of nuclear factor kappa-B kinase subunit beta isoform X2 [Nematostella vectensis]|uniref:inhibitor of nuclear factor kappa-B kinase subunit beta isoform X2 n=1 Tax=Nematostella vectensis TaxID=45351 RepID=UPI0020778BD7|nr:inhibitor of nuclear factor kappa-B kinase subunit beta isoform X2 [Nematostella vectensis]
MESNKLRQSSQDGWVEERCVGTGSFGTVTLWENKITKEQIVLKKCRLDLSPSNRNQWQKEVEIMKGLDHPNIVKAIDVPAVLDVREGQLPLLGMEYCEGGDLRKVLNSPDNCAGLKEASVLRVITDIANAVQFLHSKRIIHRDLKPENIVINFINGNAVYKLIDLGYAKQLDQGSMASTFVGTLKYLAPELLAGNGSYSKTVDYWSLGTVVFECITGRRPFPDLSPVQWHMEIREKSARDIHAYFDASGELKFSELLPTPNSLTSFYQERYVFLLRLLLLWDAKERGGRQREDGVQDCFHVIQELANAKVVHVYCVANSVIFSYEVVAEETVGSLKQKLQNDTEIPIDSQELLTASGEIQLDDAPTSKLLGKTSNGEQQLMFLFMRNGKPQSPYRPIFSLSPSVQAIVTEPKTLLLFEELKKAQGEALHFCQDQKENFQHLLQAHRAAMKHALKLNAHLTKLRSSLQNDLLRLRERVAFFKESLSTDLQHYSDEALHLKSDGVFRSWKEAERTVESFSTVDISTIENDVTKLQGHVMELQRHSYAHAQIAMDDIFRNGLQSHRHRLGLDDARNEEAH